MWIRRKTPRFPRICLSQSMTHRVRLVKNYQDFYHCGRWVYHHNSRGFHVDCTQWNSLKLRQLISSCFKSYCFLKEKSLFLRHWLQNKTGLHMFKLLLLLWKANLHEMYSHTTGTWKYWTLPPFVVWREIIKVITQ